MKLLKDGKSATANLVAASEIQIAIDITHEPWRSLAKNVLLFFEGELNECGITIGGLDQMLDIIELQPKELQ